jgi:hypothetical protein
MIRRIAVVGLLLSCHRGDGASHPTIPAADLDGRSTTADAPAAGADAPAAPAQPPAPLPELAPEGACARFDALAGEGCSWTQRFPPEFRQASNCVASLATWVSPATAEHAMLQGVINCWALDCDAAAACMVRLQAGAAPPPPRSCGDEGTAAIYVDAGAWAARRGAATKRFADVKTTVDAPIEVCGIEGEVEWMTRVVCNDGTNPYGTQAAANDSRDGWVARGGRCNSILDRYSVRCPEATYQVHVDRYVCPREP